jgi:hypothetical protein
MSDDETDRNRSFPFRLSVSEEAFVNKKTLFCRLFQQKRRWKYVI